MDIRHESIKVNGVKKIYIYVEVADEYEFGEEFLKSGKNTSFLDKLKAYVNQEVKFDKNDAAVLIVNGVLIGAISLGVFTNSITTQVKENTTQPTETSYQVAQDYLNKSEKEKMKALSQVKEYTEVAKTEAIVNETVATTAPAPATETVAPIAVTNAETPKVATAVKTTTTANTVATPVATTGQTIKLNTNGTVVTMNLEDYVVGVVASEMQPTFQVEALKSQAIVARTFAMNKTSQGVVLLNSTAHQTFKSEAQLKKLWGNSYTTNINKIKSAVTSTKGMVLKYNGKYINAMYHAISNSKTEMPKYVWGSNVPYLQSVSSNWDTKVKGYEVSTNISYDKLSAKLGKTINKDTVFTVLSETVSGRVENIKIGDTTYSGVKLRSLLGLRSTDFTITKGATEITVTTRGFGHGVGMSQSGANEAAKEGYTYDKILKHYYTGVSIVKI